MWWDCPMDELVEAHRNPLSLPCSRRAPPVHHKGTEGAWRGSGWPAPLAIQMAPGEKTDSVSFPEKGGVHAHHLPFFSAEVCGALNVTVSPGPVVDYLEGENATLLCHVSQKRRKDSLLAVRWFFARPNAQEALMVKMTKLRVVQYYGNYSRSAFRQRLCLLEERRGALYTLSVLTLRPADQGHYVCKVQEISKHRNKWTAWSNGSSATEMRGKGLCSLGRQGGHRSVVLPLIGEIGAPRWLCWARMHLPGLCGPQPRELGLGMRTDLFLDTGASKCLAPSCPTWPWAKPLCLKDWTGCVCALPPAQIRGCSALVARAGVGGLRGEILMSVSRPGSRAC